MVVRQRPVRRLRDGIGMGPWRQGRRNEQLGRVIGSGRGKAGLESRDPVALPQNTLAGTKLKTQCPPARRHG